MSLNGKNSVHYKKKDLASQKSLAFGMKKIKLWHQATVGDTSIDLQALSFPAVGAPSYAANPAFADIAAAKLLLNPTNLTLISSIGGVLDFDSYEVKSNSEITLSEPAEAGEVFVGVIDYVAKTGVQMIDVDPLVVTGTLAASATSFATGKPYEINKYPSGQQGAILVFLDGQLMARNVSNAAAAPGADGDYQEVDAGNGTGISIEFNASAGVDRSVMIVNSGVMGIAPSDSVIAQIENVAGQVDRLVETVAALAGIAESELQSAPNSVDLLAFGSRMDDVEDLVDKSSSQIKADVVTDEAGTGAPDFPKGLTRSDQTNWINVSSEITNVFGASNLVVSDAWARVSVDGNGKYSVEFSMRSTHDSTTGNITLQFAGVLASYVQALATSPRATGTTGSANIEISGGASRIFINATGAARTNAPVSGTFLVASKPSWA